jgi:ATP-dependent helicase/nuclease subunit A
VPHWKPTQGGALVSSLPLEALLSRNGCLFAGAGAGKTHGLLTAALGLLAGAGRPAPLPPRGLCLLTFTEKAAADMRERLRARVEALAEGRAVEPELDAAFLALATPPPPPAFWRAVQTQLDAATLSTFHAYCARLLRQAPAGAGIPVGFELLGEEDALELLVDTAEQCVLDRLDAGDADVEALCAQAELRGVGRGSGLLDLLVSAVARLREEGRDAASLPVGEPDTARQVLLLSLSRAEALVQEALQRATLAPPALTAALAACLDVLHGLDADASPERLARLETLAQALPRTGRNGLRDALASAREALLDGTAEAPGVASAHAGCTAIRHERTLRRLCAEVEADFRGALRRGGWMDFAELLVAARDLLRDDVHFRASVQARLGAVLVDEVQDTNHLQLELVVLLSEARANGPRRVAKERAAVLQLPLEPAFLLAVGDRKQSIYDFRGADVATFESLAAKVEEEGGARHFLRDNRRSEPALLHVLNAAAQAALPEVAGPRDYEVVFVPEEDGLLPLRPQVGPEVCVDALPVVDGARGSGREAEADVLARWLHFLLSNQGPPTVVEGGVLRQARGGDVAILLRGFSGLETYRSALRAHGVPHVVLREQNPYTAPSVLDAAAFCGLLADRGDALCLAAVLRSPLVGLTDASLFRLSERGRLEAAVLDEPLPSGFPEAEGERFLQFAAFLRRVSALSPPLPLAPLLEALFQGTGYRAAVAAGPEAEASLSALERLQQLARHWDAGGRGDVGAFARRLRGLAEQTVVGGATGVEQARTQGAVQLLSIHAAKGLEWPVVCLADLGTTGVRTPSDRLLLDRGLGLAFKPQGPFDAEPRKTPRWLLVQAELKRREKAEAGRLLYVALTRAQSRLVLSGGSSAVDAWRNRLAPALEAPDVAPLVQELELGDIPEAPPVAPSREEAPQTDAARTALERLRAPLHPRFEGVSLEVGALEDFHRCPRRSWLLEEVGLLPAPGDAAAPTSTGVPVRHVSARGALLGRLASSLSPEEWAQGAPDAALVPHLAVLGLSVGEARALGLLAPLQALANSRALKAAVASGTLRPGWARTLDVGPAILSATPTLAWTEAGRLHLVQLLPGALPPRGLDAFAVTASVLWHASKTTDPRVGLFFADGEDGEPRWVEAAPWPLQALARAAQALLQDVAGLPPRQPLEVCEALGCSFRSRCHASPGSEASLGQAV